MAKDRGSRTEGRRQPALRFARRALWILLPLAAVGEVGHQVLGRLGRELAHHFFHLAFGVGAGIAFAVYVAFDIRRNGRPRLELRRPKPGRASH